MVAVLLAWIGNKDLGAAAGDPSCATGPIAQALDARGFDRVVLLDDRKGDGGERYVAWLGARTRAPIVRRPVRLSSPTHHGEIYREATAAAAWAVETFGKKAALTFHLSAGTPAMASIWIIVAKTRFPAELLESSIPGGVLTAEVPFELSAELVPAAVRRTEEELARVSSGAPLDEPGFADILYRSEAMKRLVFRAQQAAAFDASVLIEGESGTGKELLAAAIHRASPRATGPFVIVNCGALPRELVESELFGHKKGSFTGAFADQRGIFERAHGGTVFLDEVGELALDAQVKLLRALQEKKVRAIGGKEEIPVDVRVLAATNRDLLREVAAGRFREDLFYRLAVLVLHVPPLREREGDRNLLIDRFLARLQERAGAGSVQKRLSPAARNLLVQHPWPGNVRELDGTLVRAFLWSRGPVIEEGDVREALFVRVDEGRDRVLDQALGEGFSLEATLAGVVRHYLERALREAKGKRTRAAQLVGFKSYQRLSQWMEKYGVKA